MSNIIKWGIAGPGAIANKFATAIKNVKGAELVAVASTSAQRANDFAKKYDIPMSFSSYEEMAVSSDVDAVYISTAHTFHKPCAQSFLNAKKHVLCEKPVCVNSAHARELEECARKNGVFLMEAMWTRFLPAIREAVKIVQSGEIGDIRGVKADFCYYCSPEEDPKLYANELAGGALLDVGIYGLTFASIFLGNNPVSIKSISDIRDDADCHTNVLMKYENGAIASLSCAIDVPKPADGYVYGTKGYIHLPDFYGAKDIYVCVGDERKHISKPSVGDGFEEEIYEVCNCIRNGKLHSDIMPMSLSIKILEQMDYIRNQIDLTYPCDRE